MRSNYKRLGDYIERCDEFNEGMQVEELQGISNNKYFQRSHTNTIGIDLTGYRVVRNNQFAFNRATTRNGDRISIALRNGTDCMVSPSYRIFKSKDENVLLSEYLMMWFRRPEFDRYARFKSHGSAHEFFDYEEMCEVELPIPSIDKQREIVKEYNIIVNRIRLNEQLNQKLEETAQALYKQWFVDFEFPDKEGKPYKSNGGEMEYNEELEQEIPKSWSLINVGDLGDQRTNPVKANSNLNELAYIGLEHMPKRSIVLDQWEFVNKIESNKSAFKAGDILFGKLRPYFHKVGIAYVNGVASTDILVITPKSVNYYGYLTMILSSNHFIAYTAAGAGGTKMPRTNWNYMVKYKVLLPSNSLLGQFNKLFEPIVKKMKTNSFSNRSLRLLNNLLLTKVAKNQNPKSELVI